MSTFPQKFRSTVSHWQATNRGLDTLYNHGRDAALPTDEVDYVIIGGGMTGVSLAYALSRQGIAPNAKIVLLEAKDVASGASGRNGGHVAPWSFYNFARIIRPYALGGGDVSDEEGLNVLQLERDNLAYVADTVEREGWAVDFWKGEKIEVSVSDKQTAFMREAYATWLEALGKSDKYKNSKPDWEWIENAEEAEKISRIKGTKGVSRGPAGSIHPHKLATHFLKAALASGQVDFFSWAPVKQFTERTDGKEGWDVEVLERGTIKTKQVIVCTNAHTRHLFPGQAIDKHLTPYQAQAANITPTPAFSGPDALKHTIVAEDGPYLIQTPHAGIVMGIGEDTSIHLGLATKKDIYEVTDDSYVKPELRKWLEEYCKKNFNGWGEEAPGEGALRIWSGIICASRDMLPLVGEVPDKKGLWVAVGFHGHGMARIPQTTRCLAQIITWGKWDDRLPTSFKITAERLDKAQSSPPFITESERVGASWKSVFGGARGEVPSLVR